MSNSLTEDIPRFAEMFRALSNPNRLILFLRLLSCCPPGTTCCSEAEMRRCVGEISRGLGVAASTVSHHVRELRQAGLIRLERRGKNIDCWVDGDAVQGLLDLLSGRFPASFETDLLFDPIRKAGT